MTPEAITTILLSVVSTLLVAVPVVWKIAQDRKTFPGLGDVFADLRSVVWDTVIAAEKTQRLTNAEKLEYVTTEITAYAAIHGLPLSREMIRLLIEGAVKLLNSKID